MDIKEIKQKRAELEANILALVRTFTDECNVEVDEINIETARVIASGKAHIVNVTVLHVFKRVPSALFSGAKTKTKI